jgi:predicted O-methyltransferase YrrM
MRTETADGSRPKSLGGDRDVQQLIVEALHGVADELPALELLPERRYDTTIFPTIGQYDWALGQVLYALVRLTRPRRIVEFSTSSGYSTSFTALALRRNGSGVLDTVDIDRHAQVAAGGWLEQLGVMEHVRVHNGDCRDVVPPLIGPDVDMLFIDTLHSFDIAEWYFRVLVPALEPSTLVHIHDVMPPEARVRIHGGPPYSPEEPRARQSKVFLLKRAIWLLLHCKAPNPFPRRPPREILPLDKLEVFQGANDARPTIDGNYFEEGVLIRELLRDASPGDAVYVHRVVDTLPVIHAQRYADRDRIQRTDAAGQPLEWNDALWCRASTLQERGSPARVRTLIAELRRRYYHA